MLFEWGIAVRPVGQQLDMMNVVRWLEDRKIIDPKKKIYWVLIMVFERVSEPGLHCSAQQASVSLLIRRRIIYL